MGDYNDLVRMINTKRNLHLIQYPTGRWGFVGGIPVELCHRKITDYGEQWVSNIYISKEEAILAAEAIKAQIL